jgi:hypothetical protein
MNVSRIGSLLENREQVDQRVQRTVVRHLPAGDVQPPATSAAVLAGGLAGTAVSYYVAYHTSISFLWPRRSDLRRPSLTAHTCSHASVASLVWNTTPHGAT